MASFLMEGNVTLLLAILCIVCCTGIEGKGTLQGDHIVFSPLRKGSNYTLGRTKSDWFLSSYDSVAEAVVLSLNSSPPYGKRFHEVISATNGNYALNWLC